MNNWKLEEIEYLKNNYNKIDTNIIISYLNRTKIAISKKVKQLKITNREEANKLNRNLRGFYFNESFFSVPNKLNSYWAGFIAADGCCDDKRNRLVIGLSDKDKNHLEKFTNDIEFTGKISMRNNTGFSKNNEKVCSIEITSKKIIEDLKKNFNITPRKTLNLHPPELDNILLTHSYMIGFLDGDGYVSKTNKDCPTFSIVADENFCKWWRKEVSNIVPKEFKQKILNKKYVETISCKDLNLLTFTSKLGTDVLNYFKNIDVPKLERKWNKI